MPAKIEALGPVADSGHLAAHALGGRGTDRRSVRRRSCRHLRRAVHDLEEHIFQVGPADLEIFGFATGLAQGGEQRLDLTCVACRDLHDAGR